jgi:phage gp36-like protein
MPYATANDFLERYDARLIGDLVSDDGTRVEVGDLPANAVVLAVLNDAGATVDAAVYVGNRYTPAQMSDLSDTAAAFVRRLVCDLALLYIKRRRGRFDPEKDAALLREVNDTLGALRDGKDLLLLTNQSEAQASTVELVRPELISVNRPRTIQNQTQNYYPNPRLRSPNGR